MKEITTTTFGLLIAYLLPGLAGLYAASFWSTSMQDLLKPFFTAESNVGLFLLVLMTALIFGLVISVIRYLFFERWSKDRLRPEEFTKLGAEGRLAAWRSVQEEHFRFHQFYGGMTVVLPFLYLGSLIESWDTLGGRRLVLFSLAFLIVEVLIGYAAVVSYRFYVDRARHTMKG